MSYIEISELAKYFPVEALKSLISLRDRAPVGEKHYRTWHNRSSNLHGRSDVSKLLGVVSSFAVDAPSACEDVVVFRLRQLEALLFLSIESGQQTVEDVVISLFVRLRYETRLFEEILLDARAFDRPLSVEVHVDVFAKTGWIVIANSPGEWGKRDK